MRGDVSRVFLLCTSSHVSPLQDNSGQDYSMHACTSQEAAMCDVACTGPQTPNPVTEGMMGEVGSILDIILSISSKVLKV